MAILDDDEPLGTGLLVSLPPSDCRLGLPEVGLTERWYGVALVECRDEGPSVVDLLESGGQQDQ